MSGWSGFCLHTSGPETKELQLHLAPTVAGSVLCRDLDYCWDSVTGTVFMQRFRLLFVCWDSVTGTVFMQIFRLLLGQCDRLGFYAEI